MRPLAAAHREDALLGVQTQPLDPSTSARERERGPRPGLEGEDVLDAVQLVEAVPLGDVGHAAACSGRQVFAGFAQQLRFAVVREQEAEQRADGRGLAAAVAAQEGVDAALGHFEIEASENPRLVEAAVDVSEHDRCSVHVISLPGHACSA